MKTKWWYPASLALFFLCGSWAEAQVRVYSMPRYPMGPQTYSFGGSSGYWGYGSGLGAYGNYSGGYGAYGYPGIGWGYYNPPVPASTSYVIPGWGASGISSSNGNLYDWEVRRRASSYPAVAVPANSPLLTGGSTISPEGIRQVGYDAPTPRIVESAGQGGIISGTSAVPKIPCPPVLPH